MDRRSFVTAVATTSVVLSGCLSGDEDVTLESVDHVSEQRLEACEQTVAEEHAAGEESAGTISFEVKSVERGDDATVVVEIEAELEVSGHDDPYGDVWHEYHDAHAVYHVTEDAIYRATDPDARLEDGRQIDC